MKRWHEMTPEEQMRESVEGMRRDAKLNRVIALKIANEAESEMERCG